MATLKQHYESIKGNKPFIGGGLGCILGIGSALSILTYNYMMFNDYSRFNQSGPSEKYMQVVQIEQKLNGPIALRDLDDGLAERVRGLKAELEVLNSDQEVISQREIV